MNKVAYWKTVLAYSTVGKKHIHMPRGNCWALLDTIEMNYSMLLIKVQNKSKSKGIQRRFFLMLKERHPVTAVIL